MGYKSIGRQLQLAREQAGYSQEQLAAKIGCSQSTLSNYEKGKRRIYLAQLAHIAEILGKPIEFFLSSSDFNSPGMHNSSGEKLNDLFTGAATHFDVNGQSTTVSSDGRAALSLDEQKLLSAYQSLSPEGKRLIIDFVTWLKKREV